MTGQCENLRGTAAFVRLMVALALVALGTSGCFLKVRQMRDEINMLRAQVVQHRQDHQALEGRYQLLQRDIETQKSERDGLARELDIVRERNSLLTRVMDENQRTQAEALVRDMEQRVARENSLRLELEEANARIETLENAKVLLEGQLDESKAHLDELTATLDATTGKLKESTELGETLRTERDDARAERDDFRRQVQALQSNSSDLTQRIETLSGELRDREKDLAAARRETEELRTSAQAVATARAGDAEAHGRLVAALREALRADVANGNARLVEETPLRIALPTDALFEPRTVLLSETGRAVLERVAVVLAAHPWSALRIEGHTDSQPVATMPFVDNWDLAAARAASVTRALAQRTDIPARKLSAASFAFFAPLGSNETLDGRRLNRRVEIVVVP
ncbi:MAG: OmpA family protein [Candidatus Sumerlaeia bacterium]|nr:OmpA family protein [Candidatus Sumerlaeia bacterium]